MPIPDADRNTCDARICAERAADADASHPTAVPGILRYLRRVRRVTSCYSVVCDE